MASYNKSYGSDYTKQVQNALKSLGANLGKAGVDGKWGNYTQAAYDKYKDQVDAMLGGGGGGSGSGNYTGFYEDRFGTGGAGSGGNYSSLFKTGGNYTVPQINYNPTSLDDLLKEANGLIGGQYDAQILSAKQGYEASQKSLAKSYETARESTQDSAVSRGMGRSSYLTDAIANVGLQETAANNQLTDNYNDTVANLEKGRADAVASYVQSLRRQQEETALNLALQQAELQYKYDALNQNWLMSQMSGSGSGSGGRSSGRSSGRRSTGTKTDWQTAYTNLLKSIKNSTTANYAPTTYKRGSARGLAAPTKGKNWVQTR
jgi:hypothetical protein